MYPRQPVLPLSLFSLFCAILSGLIFWLLKGSSLAFVPLLAAGLLVIYPLAAMAGGGVLLVGLCLWALLIDDVSQVAWGRQYEAITEILGKTLYESVGISGLEALAILFSLSAIIKLLHENHRGRLQGGLSLTVIMSSFFLASLVALVVGLAAGGDLNTHFIQTRFLHLLPMWCLISYAFLNTSLLAKLLVGIIIVIFLKSLQAIFIFYTNPAVFATAEYLVDHYFSMFSVLSASLVIAWSLVSKWPLYLKLLGLLSQVPVVWAFALNDRRTAFAAIFFGVFVLLGSFTKKMLIANRQKIFYLSLLLLPILFVSLAGPGPIGFIRGPLLSIINESSELPSYRDLENANLLNAAATSPLTGLGTGREFEEVYPMPDISFVYDRYKMIPHNLLLASWSYQGPLGIATLLLMFSFMLGVAVKLFSLGHIYAGVAGIFFITQYFAFTYADLALQIPRNQLFAGVLTGGLYALLRKNH